MMSKNQLAAEITVADHWKQAWHQGLPQQVDSQTSSSCAVGDVVVLLHEQRQAMTQELLSFPFPRSAAHWQGREA